jgi:LacI family transcriptional regulator
VTSIQDVAEDAGVSIGTVSNVLNRPELVRAATRGKVEASIRRLGFVRNESARLLRAGSSKTVAYVVLDAANPFFTDVARGIDQVCREKDLILFLCNTDQDAGREDRYLELLAEQRVKGILITATDYDNPRLQGIRSMGVPVVLVDRSHGSNDWCCVGVQDVDGGHIAIAHLMDQGHRKIAFAGGPMELTQVRERHEGAVRAARAAGLAAAWPALLITDGLTISDGRRVGERLLGIPNARRPTAVFCANDLIALGVLQHLIQHGVDVPGDMAIIGYDDIEFAAAAAVPLTSVAQPRHQLGRAAAEMLLEEAEQGVHHTHREQFYAPELVARASTAKRRRTARH